MSWTLRNHLEGMNICIADARCHFLHYLLCAPANVCLPAAKATDENLTSEDWGAIIEVCDKVSGDQNGSKEAVQSMIKRLAHRNANVQLYTLEVRRFVMVMGPPLAHMC